MKRRGKQNHTMAKAKVFSGWLNGTWTEIKAYRKENAVAAFQNQNKCDMPITAKDIKVDKNARNSGQSAVDEQ